MSGETALRGRSERMIANNYMTMQRIIELKDKPFKDRAQNEATTLLSEYPNLKLVMAICSPTVPGAAEPVKQAGKAGKVKVIGLGLPSENRAYVKDGVTDTVILWKTEDLGYLTVCAAQAVATVALKAGTTSVQAGRPGVWRRMRWEGTTFCWGNHFCLPRTTLTSLISELYWC
jgi:hypothetical protein